MDTLPEASIVAQVHEAESLPIADTVDMALMAGAPPLGTLSGLWAPDLYFGPLGLSWGPHLDFGALGLSWGFLGPIFGP